MERDFLGLGSKYSSITVKEEINDSFTDSALTRGVERTFSNKGSAAHQFLSFGPSQEHKHRNSFNDCSPPSDAFTAPSTHHVSNPPWMPPYSSVQEVRMFPVSSQRNQTITSSMAEHGLQSHFKIGGQSFINSSINSQPLGGLPFMATPSSIVGTTNIRSSSKPLRPPTQLTIFYAGSVSVYEDMSPEMAQAIMLLAKNEPQAKPFSMPLAQQPVHHSPPTIDPPSFLPSMSYIVSETGLGATKTTERLKSPRNNQTNASNLSCSMTLSCATNMSPAANAVGLPQVRKASLSRFLEKRKERVISVSPYYIDNLSSTDCTTPISECVSSSLSSSSAGRPN